MYKITPINLELATFQKHGDPSISFFLRVLTRSNFDHYTRECGFGILKKKNKTCSSSNSLATPFGSAVMSPMGENGLAPLEGGSESPSPVKAELNCL